MFGDCHLGFSQERAAATESSAGSGACEAGFGSYLRRRQPAALGLLRGSGESASATGRSSRVNVAPSRRASRSTALPSPGRVVRPRCRTPDARDHVLEFGVLEEVAARVPPDRLEQALIVSGDRRHQDGRGRGALALLARRLDPGHPGMLISKTAMSGSTSTGVTHLEVLFPRGPPACRSGRGRGHRRGGLRPGDLPPYKRAMHHAAGAVATLACLRSLALRLPVQRVERSLTVRLIDAHLA